jgi:hypothetical protein
VVAFGERKRLAQVHGPDSFCGVDQLSTVQLAVQVDNITAAIAFPKTPPVAVRVSRERYPAFFLVNWASAD